MKNALTTQVGMLEDMFLWLVANLKQWPFIQQNRLVAMVNGHVCNFLFILLFFAHLFFISSILLHFALSITNKLCERLLKTYFEQTLPFHYRYQNLRFKSWFQKKLVNWFDTVQISCGHVLFFPKNGNLINDIYFNQTVLWQMLEQIMYTISLVNATFGS